MTHKIKESQPSRFSKWLIKRIFKDEGEEKLGDFMEIYSNLAEEKGQLQARLRFWWYLIRSIPEYFKDSLCTGGTMFMNYLKIALRNMKRHKGYSFIYIAGMAVGLTCSILILLYVQYELSYDKYHKYYDRIYRVIQYQPEKKYLSSDYFAPTQGPLGPELMNRYPEVISTTRINKFSNVLISSRKSSFLEPNIFFADPEIFEIFSFELLKGDRHTALNDPYSMVISERMAEKYFGSEDPVGKVIRYQNSDEFRIKGVLKNIPENSHLKMEFIASFKSYTVMRRYNPDRWEPGWFCYTYCLLHQDTDPNALENKLVSLSDEVFEINQIKSKLVLQPLSKIHLYSNINFEISDIADIRYIYILSFIAFVILLIACINYMNLATARSAQRSKEVGIRKVVGAQNIQLIKQFIGESLVFTFSALILSILFVLIFLPTFNSFFERNITFNLGDNFQFILILFMLVISTGIISGSYPALFISSFKPVTALKGTFSKRSKSAVFRNFLVVIQFSITIIFIICTLAVKSQLKYIRNVDVGYNKDQIVVLAVRDSSTLLNKETIKTEFLKNPNIIKISSSSCLPNSITSFQPDWPNDQIGNKVTVYVGHVDYDFTDLYDIKVIKGRNFSRDFPSDENRAILLNEAAVKSLGWESTLGRVVSHYGSPEAAEIIGIVKDFNFQSLRSKIKPLYLFLDPSRGNYLSVKIKASNIPETIEFLRAGMKRFSPNYPFEYYFFDDVFDMAYRAEQKMESIFSTFAFLSIFIACLGLLGLVSFVAEQKTKEIGIRKVLGASATNIISLLSKKFIKWIIVANVVAWPIAYYFMNKWLQNFAYKAHISLLIFFLSGTLALIIATLTIGYQTIKAATANPVDSLRYE